MALLLVLSLAYYPDLVSRGLILVDYDVFVYFYPLRQFAASAIAQGRLPVWNPDLFFGSPFLANPQTALFYPLSSLFYVLPIPTAYTASLVLHTFLAGAFCYAFARRTLSLGAVGSLVGAVAFMFSGFFAGQAGHLNQFSAAAWLPLMLLCFDEASRRGSLLMVVAAAAVVGIQFLAGHPQESYISLLVVGLFQVSRVAIEAPRRLPWTVATLGLGTGLGAGLAALQLLPSALWSSESVRSGGLDFREAAFAAVPPWEVPWAVLPGFAWHSLASTEWLGYVGIVPLVGAVVALLAVGRAVTLSAALVAAIGLALSVGAALPLYQLLFDHLPLFDRFRVPGRWLFAFCFGAAVLAALGVDWANSQARPLISRRWVWSRVARAAMVTVLLVLAFYWAPQFAAPVPRRLIALWLALAASGLLALALLRRSLPWRPVVIVVLLAACTAELFLAARDLPYRFVVPPDVYRMPRATTSDLAASPPGRLLSVATENYEPHDGAVLRQRYHWLPPQSMQNYLHAVKLDEDLAPNLPLVYGLATADGYDGGVLPSRRFVEFSQLLIPKDLVRSDGVWQSRLEHVPSPRLLDLIGVGAVVASTVRDVTVDGVTYDRALAASLEPSQSLSITRLPDDPAGALGLLSSFEGPQLDYGEEVGVLEVRGADGQLQRFSLRYGSETASVQEPPFGALDPPEAIGQAVRPGRWDYHFRFPLAPARLVEITLRNTAQQGKLHVKAVTLIQEAAGKQHSVVLFDRVERESFQSSKIYRLRDALPPAYLVSSAVVLADEPALQRLADERFDPRTEVVLSPHPEARALEGPAISVPAQVERLTPEHIRAEVDAPASGYLVVSEAIAPGWQAWIDGRPAPLLRANYLFQSVPVTPGRHVVELRYEPPGFALGLQLSGFSLVCLLVLIAADVAILSRRTRGHRGESG